MRAAIKSVFVGAAVAALVTGAMGAATAQDSGRGRMAQPLVDAAGAFEAYTSKTAAIDPKFKNGQAVADALKVGAGYEAKQLQMGMVAYGALAALQSPEFVEGVREAARGEGAAELARRIAARPDTVLYFRGAELGGARAGAALQAQAEALNADGARVKQAAYDVQHQAWSKATVPNAPGRLARVKQISATPYAPTAADGTRLMQALGAARDAAPPPPTPVIQRALALAALTVLDQAADDQVMALAEEPNSASCVRMAKLNLYQCLAVAGPHYEDVFCLGEHAMLEPAKCVSKAAGVAMSVGAPPQRSTFSPIASARP